jgi:hypothetical protein
MLKLSFNEISSNELYSSIEEELLSNEYEFESLISDLCVEIGARNLAVLTISIDKVVFETPIDPALAYLLSELPYIASLLRKGSELDYTLSLNPEFDSSQLKFEKDAMNNKVLITYSIDENSQNVSVKVSESTLLGVIKHIVCDFTFFIQNMSKELYSHDLFQTWLESETIRPVVDKGR